MGRSFYESTVSIFKYFDKEEQTNTIWKITDLKEFSVFYSIMLQKVAKMPFQVNFQLIDTLIWSFRHLLTCPL